MKNGKLFTKLILKGEVLLKFKDGNEETIKAELVDMSFKGVGVYCTQKLAVGTDVGFLISSSMFEKNIGGEGKITNVYESRRVNKAGAYLVGIEFISVNSEQLREILTRLHEQAIVKKISPLQKNGLLDSTD